MQWISGSLLAVALVPAALAQSRGDYPAQPVKIVVPFSAGSASDTVARVLSEELRPRFGTIVVDNKPGANGIIGASYVARAGADGHTLILTSSATHSGIGALYKHPGYDPIADFAHISRIATIPMVLVARPGAPFKTAQELAAQARQTRLRFGYGSGSAQIAGATFSTIADAPSDAIPYKSQPPAITDLLGGRIDYVLADASVVTSFLQGGPRRARHHRHPPPARTAGRADDGRGGLPGLRPRRLGRPGRAAKTPAPIVAQWNEEIRAGLQRPGVVAKLARLGMVPSPNTVVERRTFTIAQRDIWVSRATKAGIERR